MGGDALLFDSDSNVTCGDEFLVEMATLRLQGFVVAGLVSWQWQKPNGIFA